MPPEKTPSETPDTTNPIWAPGLSVGNAKLDEQHIMLLELGKHLLNLVKNDSSSHEEIQAVLKDIAGLAREHDEMEEAVLEENECPSLAEHKRVHEAARTELDGLLRDASRNIVDKAVLTRVITEWRSHHVSKYDLLVKDYMKANSPAV
ncbi:MAG: hemerythrin family protein [Polaromonas sp.]